MAKINLTKKPLEEVKPAKKKTKKTAAAATVKEQVDGVERITYGNDAMKLEKAERETHLYISQDEKQWHVYTNIESDRNKMARQGWTLLKEERLASGTFLAAWFSCPRKSVTIGRAATIVRKRKDKALTETAEGAEISGEAELAGSDTAGELGTEASLSDLDLFSCIGTDGPESKHQNNFQ